MRKAKKRQGNRLGSIYKDGDGYRADILLGYDETGRPIRKKVRTQTHAEAVEAIKRLQSEERAGTLTPSNTDTLATFVEIWLEGTIRPLRAPKTYSSYAYAMRVHVLPTLGRLRLNRITKADVQALFSALSKQTVQPRSNNPSNTAKKCLSTRTLGMVRDVLRAVFQEAIARELVGKNPVTNVSLPKESDKQPVFLRSVEVSKLIGVLSSTTIGPLVRFLLCTGTRIGEARGVRWQDLDLDAKDPETGAENPIVRIRGQLQRIEGKLTYRSTTKTNQDRVLPLPLFLAAELKTLRDQQVSDGIEDPDGIVFLNPEGRRLDEKYVSDRLKAACIRAGIPPVSPHKLRHTAATLALAESGGDLHAVQKMLGHQQSRLTADLYGHATPERLRGPMAYGDRLLGQVSEKISPPDSDKIG